MYPKSLALLSVCAFLAAELARAQGFVLPTDCKLPFDAIKGKDLAIDADCSIDGNAGDNNAKRLESNAKNNFCATAAPVPITYSVFTKLQTASDNIEGLRKKLASSRADLTDLVKVTNGPRVGEGTPVRFVGFMHDAHVSNKKAGELVNCQRGGDDRNDIHVELVNDAGEDDMCASVTAEMSPHFRPEAWTALAGLRIERPVRVTGPLFFDGSHKPCAPGKRTSPARISVWEIHPVYAFDVCSSKDIKACRKNVSNDSFWVPLNKWHSHEEDEEDEPND